MKQILVPGVLPIAALAAGMELRNMEPSMSMSAELKRILEMVSKKKLSVAEGDQKIAELLFRSRSEGSSAASERRVGEDKQAGRLYLTIRIQREGRTPVKIRMPFFLPRTPAGAMKMAPKLLRATLSRLGIDFAEIENVRECWETLLQTGSIEVEGRNKMTISVEA